MSGFANFGVFSKLEVMSGSSLFGVPYSGADSWALLPISGTSFTVFMRFLWPVVKFGTIAAPVLLYASVLRHSTLTMVPSARHMHGISGPLVVGSASSGRRYTVANSVTFDSV